MDDKTDSFEELLKLCEDFMRTAFGVNSKLESSNWLNSLNDYNDLTKSIMKCRARQQDLQKETIAKIRNLEKLNNAEKEKVSLMKEKLEEDEKNLADLREGLDNKKNDEILLNEEIKCLREEFDAATVRYYQTRVKEAIQQRDRSVNHVFWLFIVIFKQIFRLVSLQKLSYEMLPQVKEKLRLLRDLEANY